MGVLKDGTIAQTPTVTLAPPSLPNDIFCKCVTRLFGLMVRFKTNAAVLAALPSGIERGSQNANGVRVESLSRVRSCVSVEIFFHAPLCALSGDVASLNMQCCVHPRRTCGWRASGHPGDELEDIMTRTGSCGDGNRMKVGEAPTF
jgi:hypothetical protein